MLKRNNNSDVSEYLLTNQLFDDGTIDEWATFNHFNHFNTSLGINSRLAFELEIEDKWLKSGALVDEFPQDEISGLDQATLSILN